MILKSRQVHFDLAPWAGPNGMRTSYVNPASEGAQSGDWNYDPRPEFQRTRDPHPWAEEDGSRFTTREAYYTGNPRTWAPRRDEYDTPVNRVLEVFRRSPERQLLLDALDAFLIGASAWATPEEVEHARRVLTRLATREET